tara:strand:+ start:1972 stop:2577 length:606 start_codon:yes stop_codon:yes gene_type:complete
MFDAPIPGQSLTTEPKNYPWERPPEMSDINEVISFYMKGMSSPQVIDNLLDMLELDTPVDAIVNAYTTVNVMKGMHNVDVKLLVSPVLHEYISTIGKAAGLDVKSSFDEVDTGDADNEQSTIQLINKRVNEIEVSEDEEDDEGVELMRQTSGMLSSGSGMNEEPMMPPLEEEEEPMPMPPMKEEQQQQSPPTGLMSRRGAM